MANRMLTLALAVASFSALAPAAVIYRGYGYGRPVIRAGVYAGPRYYYGPRVYAPYVAPVVPYVAPAPVYAGPYYGYGYRYGYAPRYYYGGGYRSYRGYRR